MRGSDSPPFSIALRTQAKSEEESRGTRISKNYILGRHDFANEELGDGLLISSEVRTQNPCNTTQAARSAPFAIPGTTATHYHSLLEGDWLKRN
ncbi:hypothetical protein ACLOJK_030206 [Asimina triloba]